MMRYGIGGVWMLLIFFLVVLAIIAPFKYLSK